MNSLNRAVRNVRRRCFAAALARISVRNAAVFLAVLAAGAALKRYTGEGIAADARAGFLLLLVVECLAESVAMIPDRIRSALILDRALDTNELISTAVEVEEKEGEIPEEIRNRAADVVCRADVAGAVPIEVKPVFVIAAVLSAALFVMFQDTGTAGKENGFRSMVLRASSAAGDLEAGGSGVERQVAAELRAAEGADMPEEIRKIEDELTVRAEDLEAIARAAAGLQDAGIPELARNIDEGNSEGAAEAMRRAMKQGTVDAETAAAIIEQLMDSLEGLDVSDAVKENFGDLEGLVRTLAEENRKTPLAAVENALNKVKYVASDAGEPVLPDTIHAGKSAPVDINSVPPRYREVVRNYFSREQ